MLLIGELLPWSLFSKGKNLGDCACPVLVIWGSWVALREKGPQGTSILVGFQENQPKPSGCSSMGKAAPCARLPAPCAFPAHPPAADVPETGCLIPSAPASLVYSGCAGSGVPGVSYAWCGRCLSVTAPRSLGKRFPCSWRESCGALPAGETSRMPAPALLLRQKALAAYQRKMKERWGGLAGPPSLLARPRFALAAEDLQHPLR